MEEEAPEAPVFDWVVEGIMIFTRKGKKQLIQYLSYYYVQIITFICI
jgi:hypothetical protein